MAEFSNIGFNNYDWDGVSNYTISEPNISLITVTGNPNTTGTPRNITLPRVDSTVLEDNFTYGHKIVIQDPN